MSNPYRKTPLTKQEAEKEFSQNLSKAKQVLADASVTPESKEFIERIATAQMQRRCVPELEKSLQSVSLIVESGDKSRELELLLTARNIERLKAGQEPERIHVPVSSACHLAAVREHTRLLEQHQHAIDSAVIDTANIVLACYDGLQRELQAERRTDAATPNAAPEPAAVKEERKAQSVTPNKAAAA